MFLKLGSNAFAVRIACIAKVANNAGFDDVVGKFRNYPGIPCLDRFLETPL